MYLILEKILQQIKKMLEGKGWFLLLNNMVEKDLLTNVIPGL